MDSPSKELVVHPAWDADRVSVSITLDGRTYHVWIAASEELGRDGDFLLPLALFPAMISGSRLKLPRGVSPRLLSAAPKIQDVFRLWGEEYWGERFSGLQPIAVDAEVRDSPIERASGVGCFFSGGVDSFYTLLKNREDITHIIFVHGFDIALEEQPLRAQASRMAQAVARDLGKSLIEVETNLRSFSDELVGWGKYHGAALASVGLLFQRRLRKVLIAATNTYAELTPWGIHQLLDPLWSTELMQFEHDGGEATRFEKTAYISRHETAMQWLRVCHANPNGVYNCGRCVKCLRTRIALRTAGAQERCKTLPHDLSLEEVTTMEISNDPSRFVLRQTVETLERLGTEPELARTLAEMLDEDARARERSPEHAQGQRLQKQLALTRKKLMRSRAKLEAARARNRELAERNRLLTVRYSRRRRRIAQGFLSIVSRLPGVRSLLGRKGAAGDR